VKKIQTILVACDFSDYTAGVFAYAAELARTLKATLIVLNVINERDVEAVKRVEREYPVASVKKYVAQLKEERTQLMDALAKETRAEDLNLKRIFKIGIPFREILETIQEENADMLVIGAKGRGNVAGVLFGSTAEKVFRRCPVPLLSVRPEGHAK
jgi:nucleotide-binding universal stress UspA family protein